MAEANFQTADNRNLDTLLTSTMEHVMNSGAFQDAIFDATPLTSALRKAGQVKMVSGGERIRVSLMYGANGTAGSYSGDDLLDVTRQEGFTSAFYNWKQYSASLVVTGREKRINGDLKSRVLSISDMKMKQAASSLIDVVTTGIYSDGTGNGSKNITGLEALIETTPGTTAYAGVPTTNTAWRNNVKTSSGAAATNLLPDLRTQYNNAAKGSGMAATPPDCIMTTQTVFESLEALLFPQLRYTSNDEANAGFDKLRFKNAKVQWDTYCTAGTAYILNLNHLYLFCHVEANFAPSGKGMQKPINQDVLVDQVLFQGNLAGDNRKKFSKITGIT